MKKMIPNYSIHELDKKNYDYALIVYAINEGNRLKNELKKLKKLALPVDVVLADGGSTDGSTKLSYLRTMKINCLLTNQSGGGLSTQMRMAFDYCLQRSYLGIICIDGNDKDDPSAIPLFIQKLQEGYDHIQGSRFILGGHHKNTPLLRLLAIKLIHAPLIRLACRFWYTDTTNGFRGYSARLLKDKKVNIFRDLFSRYELHYHLAIESVRRGYKVIEVPVTRIYPRGKVPTKIHSWKALVEIIGVLLRFNIGYYRMK